MLESNISKLTPNQVRIAFSEIFDETSSFELWAYNIEIAMAENVEAILRRSIFNMRPSDISNAYILTNTQKYDASLFSEALNTTTVHCGTTE